MTTCAYCGHDTIDAHQIELCADCCACREDLAGEVLAIAEGLNTLVAYGRVADFDRTMISRHAFALAQLAARLSRTGEAVRDG